MSDYTKNRKFRINPETSAVEVETFFQIDPTTIDENRKLYTEDEVKYFRSTYGGFFFDKKLHKFGAYTYTCGSMFFTEDASRVTERVYQTDGKHEQRENKKQDDHHVEVTSLEGMSFTDDEGYLDCNIPDLHDQLDDLMENNRIRAIVKALHQVKERYVDIFLLMLNHGFGPTDIADALNMKKQTVSDDMKKIKEIAKKIYFA